MNQASAIFLHNGNVLIIGKGISQVLESVSEAVIYCRENAIEARMLTTKKQ